MKLGNLSEVIDHLRAGAPDRRQERRQGHDPDQGALRQPAQGARLRLPGDRRARRHTTSRSTGGLSVDGASGAENMFYVDGQETGKSAAPERAAGRLRLRRRGRRSRPRATRPSSAAPGRRGQRGDPLRRQRIPRRHRGLLFGQRHPRQGTQHGHPRPAIPQPTRASSTTRTRTKQDSRLEGGFCLGGYILKDKLWFYVNALPVFRQHHASGHLLVAPDPATRPPIPSTTPESRVIHKYDFTQTDNDLNFQVKLSSQPVENMRLSLGFVNNYNEFKGGLSAASTAHPQPLRRFLGLLRLRKSSATAHPTTA